MREQADDKKDAAWKLADAFLDGVFGDAVFDSRYDRGMAVMMVVARFICQEQITPESYLKWLTEKVGESIFEAAPEEAEAIAEKRRTKICH